MEPADVPADALTVGVDVGGTKIAAGVVDSEGKLLAHTRRETPAQNTEGVLAGISDAVRELAAVHEIRAVGIGAAGFVDARRTTVMFAPNLAWRDEDLRSKLTARLNLPVVVENDANAVAWAESRFGSGPRPRRPRRHHDRHRGRRRHRRRRAAAARRVRRGRRDRPHHDGPVRPALRVRAAGLLGAVRLRARAGHRGPRDRPALPGVRRRPARGRRRRPRRDHRARWSRRPPSAATSRALHCFDEIGRWIGLGCAQLAAVLDPSLFVIGGGVSAAGEVLRVAASRRTFRSQPHRARPPSGGRGPPGRARLGGGDGRRRRPGTYTSRHRSHGESVMTTDSPAGRRARRRPRTGAPPKTTPKAILVSIVAAVGGFLFGFDSSVINGAVDALNDQFDLNDSPLLSGFAVACALLGSAVGAWFAGPVADRYGRVRVMLIAAGAVRHQLDRLRARVRGLGPRSSGASSPASASASPR